MKKERYKAAKDVKLISQQLAENPEIFIFDLNLNNSEENYKLKNW